MKMKKFEKKEIPMGYEAPLINIEEVNVEAGFTTSPDPFDPENPV